MMAYVSSGEFGIGNGSTANTYYTHWYNDRVMLEGKI